MGIYRKGIAVLAAAVLGMSAFPGLPAGAADAQTHYYGDLDGKRILEISDLAVMKRG